MKSLLVVLLLSVALLTPADIKAQNLLNQPESVVFDSLHIRYLVSNYATGDIVQIDEFDNQSYFDTTLTRIAGLLIKGDTLLVVSNLEPYIGLVGYSLVTDEMLFYVPIASDGLLNDLDYDSENNVYISDYWDSKLFKVNLSTLDYTLFVPSIYQPNGVLCDTLHNRLLVLSVGAAGSPILGVDLDDGSVSIVVRTNIYSLDGLARDNQSRVYISSWWSNSCYRYDSVFANPAELVSSDHSGPADIYVNRQSNILCVPNFYYNNVEFIQLEPNAVDDYTIPDKLNLTRSYPNPFNSSTTIEYNLLTSSNVIIEIFDIQGRKLRTLIDSNQPVGKYRVNWNADNFSSGTYFFNLRTQDQNESGKMILLK